MEFVKKVRRPVILVICVAVIVYVVVAFGTKRDKLDYRENIDETVFSIENENFTFGDLAFYILYEEATVEKQALIYNSQSSKDYWNLHVNGVFIQQEAKEVVLEMAQHDRLFYMLACKEGMDALTEDEELQLANATTDFWEDLLDQQLENLPVDRERVEAQIKIAAVAEKYQNYLAAQNGPSVAAYKYDGYYYEQMKKDYKIKVNSKLADRLVLGDISLNHSNVNYINGYNDEKKKKN